MNKSSVACIDRWLRKVAGVGLVACVGFVLFLAMVGAGLGLGLPKFQANALLDVPGADLAEVKRIMPGYASHGSLAKFVAATDVSSLPSTERLLQQALNPSFWDAVATPVMPISKRDMKDFGELKGGAGASLIGLELKADARDPGTATAMVQLMSEFLANGMLRERMRTWIVTGLGETRTRQKTLRADIIALQLKIESAKRRVADMESMVTRYPEVSKLDGRLVSVSEGGDKFLPPYAQLVAAESSITESREAILQAQRRVQQLDLLANFYASSEAAFKRQFLVRNLIPELVNIAEAIFPSADALTEWSSESQLRVQAAISEFAVTQAAFGIRNGARVGSTSRTPVTLALIGAVLAVALVSALIFVRAASRGEAVEAEAQAQGPVLSAVPGVKAA